MNSSTSNNPTSAAINTSTTSTVKPSCSHLATYGGDLSTGRIGISCGAFDTPFFQEMLKREREEREKEKH